LRWTVEGQSRGRFQNVLCKKPSFPLSFNAHKNVIASLPLSLSTEQKCVSIYFSFFHYFLPTDPNISLLVSLVLFFAQCFKNALVIPILLTMKTLPITTLFTSLICRVLASDPEILFDRALEIRNQFGLRDEQRRILQESLSFSPNEGNEGNEKRRLLFDRVLLAKTKSKSAKREHKNEIFGRKLQSGSLSIADFCIDITGDPSTVTHCEGDLTGEWKIVTQHEESCFYIDEEEEMPFDESRFNPDTDFCFKWGGIFFMNKSDAERHELTVEISLPTQGVYREVSDLDTCEHPNQDLDFITGYCDSCSVVEIEGMSCDSCERCPEGSAGNYLIDCSNVDPSLVTKCETDDDELFWSFNGYIGTDCTFDAVTNGRCPLHNFCAQLQETLGGTVICSGDVTEKWSVQLQGEESCYYLSPSGEQFGKSFDEATFDDTTDYCLKPTVTLSFERAVPTIEEFMNHVTRPAESEGVVSEFSELAPCDVELPDYDFHQGYCYTGCPAFVIGGVACEDKCITCPDGYEALDCSNVKPTMIESCSVRTEDEFTLEAVAFFNGRHIPQGLNGIERVGTEKDESIELLDGFDRMDTEEKTPYEQTELQRLGGWTEEISAAIKFSLTLGPTATLLCLLFLN
jgi:hypothetical protein